MKTWGEVHRTTEIGKEMEAKKEEEWIENIYGKQHVITVLFHY